MGDCLAEHGRPGAITAGIDIAVAIYGVGMITRMFGLDPNTPVFGGIFGWTLTSWGFYIFIMFVLMIPQVLINIYGIRLTAMLNDFSVYWHIGGVLIIALLLAIFGKNHQPLSFVTQFFNTVNPLDASSAVLPDGTTGPALIVGTLVIPSPLFAMLPFLEGLYRVGPFLLVFPLAFLQAQWTYTGYDASAHVAEETVLARLNSAWGVFLSVAVSATVTSMSRMFFAFGRDGGMPFSNAFCEIHPRLRTPVKSIIITSVLAILFCVYSAAYFVVTSISTITLYIAYNIPIFLNVRNKLRKKGEFTTRENAPWNLKGWGPFLNIIAVVYTIFITILFCLPPNELVLWSMVGFSLILLVYWFGYARKHFTGPRKASEEELRRIEEELDRLAHAPAHSSD